MQLRVEWLRRISVHVSLLFDVEIIIYGTEAGQSLGTIEQCMNSERFNAVWESVVIDSLCHDTFTSHAENYLLFDSEFSRSKRIRPINIVLERGS